MSEYQVAGTMSYHVERMSLAFSIDVPVAKVKDHILVRRDFACVLPKAIREKLEAFDEKVKSAYQQIVLFEEANEERAEEQIITEYVSETELEKFKEELINFELEYFRLRDEILAEYDKLVEQFIRLFLVAMIEPEYRDQMRAQLRRIIPSKEEYGNSYKMAFSEYRK